MDEKNKDDSELNNVSLSQRDRDFIESLLAENKKTLTIDEDSRIVAKKDKNQRRKESKKDKVPGYKNPAHWIGAFFILPFLLSGIFLLFMIRAENFLGKESLEWLSQQKIDDSVRQAATDAGFGWIPMFLAIYQYRWIIVISVFTICFIVAGLIMFNDSKKYRKNNIQNDKNNNIKDDTKNVDDDVVNDVEEEADDE